MYFNFNLSPAKYIWRVILFINYLSNHHHSFHINIVNYACRIHLPFSSCLCFFFVSDELLAFNEGSCFHFFVHCSFIFFLQQGFDVCMVWRFHGNRVVKFAWSVVFMATKLWISKSIVFMATKLWISKSIVVMTTWSKITASTDKTANKKPPQKKNLNINFPYLLIHKNIHLQRT